MHPILLDAAGHRRQPVTLPGYHAGRTPRNKGRRYPADPPTVEEIIAVMRAAGAGPDGVRLRALIVLLWRAGLRIGEALALSRPPPVYVPLRNPRATAAGERKRSSATATAHR
jgi:integrase